MCEENEHDFLLSSREEKESKKVLNGDPFGVWTHFHRGTLICRKCGMVKYVDLDVRKVRH